MIAALYVLKDGPYFGIDGVDPWDEARDARNYPGPYPVVAHPPCGRWCSMAKMNEKRWGALVGDDGGCFAAGLDAVFRWGGVLEHPAQSLAWPAFRLWRPVRPGWMHVKDQRSRFGGYWVCELWQSAYGHLARKRTWLLFCGEMPPHDIDWSRPKGTHQVGGGVYTGNNAKPRLNGSATKATPEPFRDLLLSMARSVRMECAA